MPLQAIASESFGMLLQQADSVRSSNPAKFRELLGQLGKLDLGEATPHQVEQLQYLNTYAQVLAGRYEEALVDAQRLLKTSTNIDTQVRAGALIVNIHAITRRFTEGLRQLEQILPLIEKAKNQDYREHALGVAAVIHNQTGQYRLGRQYAERVLAKTASNRAKCYAGQTRLEAMQNLKELPREDAPFNDLIALCNTEREAVVANLTRAMLARKWAAEGQRVKAIDLLRNHLSEVKATRYPRLISEFESLLGEYELAQGNLSAAEQYSEAAIAQGAGSDYTLPLVTAHRTRYLIAEAKGDQVKAFAYYRQYARADKAYLNEIKARELAYQIVRHETLQQMQQIELLNQQNQVLQLQQRVQEQTAQNTRLIVVLLVMLLASIAFWAYKTKRVQMSLRRMAETDALTGICNRHHFTQQSELALTQCARAGEDVALVMFDLDHFKSINDRFGHVTGDWVLQRVSEGCKGFCRRIDHLGRLGGEEFAILLAGCDLRHATRIAEDCRVRIASIDTQPSGYKFVVTASFGVTATSLSGYDLTKLLSHADQMLYRAKREGRNRVFAYDGDTASEFKEHAATRQEELLLVPEGQQQAELPRIA
jgi:diguanylate cyclase (GGDEF)-like protein